QEAAANRVRMLMSDPLSMQVRKSSLNAGKTAVCMEIDYNESGSKVTARQALVTPAAVLIEPDKNDVAHRVFEINARDLGCDAALVEPPKRKCPLPLRLCRLQPESVAAARLCYGGPEREATSASRHRAAKRLRAERANVADSMSTLRSS